jgi:hypothetical protein
MNRHPDIRQRTALSAKSLRWRRVEFLRPFPGSMGSAPLEAIVSSFLNKFRPESRAAMMSEKYWYSIETIVPDSSPFDI